MESFILQSFCKARLAPLSPESLQHDNLCKLFHGPPAPPTCEWITLYLSLLCMSICLFCSMITLDSYKFFHMLHLVEINSVCAVHFPQLWRLALEINNSIGYSSRFWKVIHASIFSMRGKVVDFHPFDINWLIELFKGIERNLTAFSFSKIYQSSADLCLKVFKSAS